MSVPGPRVIQNFITDRLLDGQSIELDQDLVASGLLNSLSVMTLVSFLEKETGMPIPAKHITVETFTSVDTITEYLSGRS